MALIYDIELPELVIDELQRLIDGCDVANLLQLAKRNSDLIRGFQTKASNAKVIQQRLKSELSKGGELESSVAEFLAEQSLNRQFICVLSTEALMHCFDELMITLGKEQLIIGLLFDKRSKVRELAVDYLNAPHDVGNDFPGARKQISEKLEQYIDIFSFVTEKRAGAGDQVALGGGKPQTDETSSQDRAKINQLTTQLEASKCNRKEVNILNKKLSNLTEIQQQTQDELDKLKQNFRTVKAQNSDLTREHSAAQQQLADLQNSQDEIVRSKVSKELEQASYAWLKRPLEIEQQIQHIPVDKSDDILTQADNILTKQVEQDRHYGNIKTLNERLHCLQAKSRHLIQAQKESIKPLSELSTINHEITAEIDKLNSLMGLKRLEPSFVDECISRINSAETAPELKATEAMLALFTNMKLLPDNELNELYIQYNGRIGLMFEQYKPSAELTDNALWWFYKLLRDNTKVHLLLDGHNILHLLSPIFSPFYENDIPGGVARGQLIERMVKAVANYPNCMVNIFFDGPEPSEYSQSVNVKVIYSGGGNSEHRADGVLLNYLQFIVGNNATEAAVIVTDDRDIQAKGQQLKAKIVSPIQFAGMIS